MTVQPSAVALVAEQRASSGLWRDAFARLKRNRPAMVGIVCIALFVTVAVFAPVLAPYDPNKGGLGASFESPSGRAPGRSRQAGS